MWPALKHSTFVPHTQTLTLSIAYAMTAASRAGVSSSPGVPQSQMIYSCMMVSTLTECAIDVTSAPYLHYGQRIRSPSAIVHYHDSPSPS